MKIIKVAIKKEREVSHCHFHWPLAWDYDASALANVVAYEDEGLPIEHAIAVVPDSLGERLVLDPDIEEIDEVTANELGQRWRPRHIRVEDPTALAEMVGAALPQIRRFVSAEGTNPLERLLRALDLDDDSEPRLMRSKRFEVGDYLK